MTTEFKKNLLIQGGNSTVAQHLMSLEKEEKNIIAIVRKRKENTSPVQTHATTIYESDATQPIEIKKVIDNIVEKHIKIDQYVHLIGSILMKPLHNTTLEEWHSVLELNLNSIFYTLKYVLPIMLKRKSGNIVLVSSVAAQVGLTNNEAISAAKGAVEAMTRSLAVTYASYDIRVNCVAPTLMRTKMAEHLVNNELAVKGTTSLNAIKRVGEPEDVANAISFLLSEKSAFITGQIISVDGGLSHVRTLPKV